MKHLLISALALAALTLQSCVFVVLDGIDSSSSSSGNAYVKIVNQLSTDILEVYVAPCSNRSWGTDRLSSFLANNESLTISVDSGWYDFKAVGQNTNNAIISLSNYVTYGETNTWYVNF